MVVNLRQRNNVQFQYFWDFNKCRQAINVNGTTFQSGLRFQTGLSSLRVSCKRILSYFQKYNNRYTIQFEQVNAVLNTIKSILKWFVFI